MSRKKRRFVSLAQALDGSQVLARGYVRVSTEDQATNGVSLEHQQDSIRKYADERGWRLDHIYQDEGASAWKERGGNRRAFAQMISEAKKGEFSVLLCLDQSRFARDLRAQAHYINLLEENSVDVVFLNEPTEQDRTTRDLVRGIMGAINEAESSLKSQLVRDNMRKKAEKGLWIGSPPDGYDSAGTGGVLQPNGRAAVIRKIFEWYLEERSVQRVARRLINAGIKPLCGGDWHRGVIRKYLRNPVYAGWMQWGGERYRGAHKPLVSEQSFAQVQEILQQRTCKAKARSEGGSLLVPWAHCGYCAYPMWITHGKRGQKYYFCSKNHSRVAGCACPYQEQEGKVFRVRDYVLEEAVLRDIMALSEAEIRSGIAKGNGKVLRRERKLRAALEQVRSRLTEQRFNLQSIVGMKLGGEITAREFNELMADYRAEQRRLEGEEQALQHNLKEQPVTNADIERTVAAVRQFQGAAVEDTWDKPQKKRELERLLEQVDVTRSAVVIHYQGRLLRTRRAALKPRGRAKKRQLQRT
jgi:site-specific DNA recombinase